MKDEIGAYTNLLNFDLLDRGAQLQVPWRPLAVTTVPLVKMCIAFGLAHNLNMMKILDWRIWQRIRSSALTDSVACRTASTSRGRCQEGWSLRRECPQVLSLGSQLSHTVPVPGTVAADSDIANKIRTYMACSHNSARNGWLRISAIYVQISD